MLADRIPKLRASFSKGGADPLGLASPAASASAAPAAADGGWANFSFGGAAAPAAAAPAAAAVTDAEMEGLRATLEANRWLCSAVAADAVVDIFKKLQSQESILLTKW